MRSKHGLQNNETFFAYKYVIILSGKRAAGK